MNGNTVIVRSIAAAVALAGASAIAYADGSTNSRFGGDGYAYFNEQMPIVNKARSDFRNDNPKGLPESYYQSASSWGPEWHPAPAIDKSGAKFRQSTPSGIPFADYQALSSNSTRWQTPTAR